MIILRLYTPMSSIELLERVRVSSKLRPEGVLFTPDYATWRIDRGGSNRMLYFPQS